IFTQFRVGRAYFQKQIRKAVLSASRTGALCGFLSLADSNKIFSIKLHAEIIFIVCSHRDFICFLVKIHSRKINLYHLRKD
ncbi:MAG: hypothetical protein LBS52_07065, partial [Dysgonamonadaceae bacterium]|nr:hypothetical protein [Dysgonamonadaceae bacterium]